MRAGELRHLITLQGLIVGQDAIGQATSVWEDVAVNVPADIRYLSALETVKADAPVDVTRCSMRIRWLAGVTSGMRAVQGVTVFDVKSVLPDPRGQRWIDMVCETGQNSG